MLWWQPTFVAFPKPSIWGDWGEFFDQLNVYFGQPDLAQASERALHGLKMHHHQHVNEYIIEFSKHATHTGWNDVVLYGEFYQGLAEHIKDQLLSLDHLQMFQQLKADALKCDTHYWECQRKKATPSGWNRQPAFTSTPEKLSNNLTASSDAPKTSCTNPGIGADRKLTKAEQEHCHLKGLCCYCGLTINLPAPNCHNTQHPKSPAVGHATFTIMGEPEATIKEVVKGPLTKLEN